MNATGGVGDCLLPLLVRVVGVLLWRAFPRPVFGRHCSVYIASQFVVLGARHDTRIILGTMIDTCRKADRKLMIAYRMQYDPVWQQAFDIVRSGALGKVQSFRGSMLQSQVLGIAVVSRKHAAIPGAWVAADEGIWWRRSNDGPGYLPAERYSLPSSGRA